jgi:F-type H+-transporting ATPase subunit epsilon
MEKTIKFEVVTQEREVLREDVLEVTIPTSEGEITVLPNHVPLISFLKSGVIVMRKASGARDVAFVSGGFVEVLKNKIVVLADAAERAEDLDEAKVEEARRRAEEAMKNVRREDAEEFAAVAAQLERALARGKAVKKWRNIRAY